MTTEATGNGNGITPAAEAPKAPALLATLHAEWVKAGSPKPDGKTAKALVGAWEKAHAAREVAEKAFAKASSVESDACAAIIRAKGKGSFKLPDGTMITPMSRGDTVYFRGMGGVDVDTFGA